MSSDEIVLQGCDSCGFSTDLRVQVKSLLLKYGYKNITENIIQGHDTEILHFRLIMNQTNGKSARIYFNGNLDAEVQNIIQQIQ